MILFKLKKFDLALRSWDDVIKLKPNNAEAYNNKGNILFLLGKYEAAIESFKEAIKIKPNYADAYNNLGNPLWKQKKIDESLARYASQFTYVYAGAKTEGPPLGSAISFRLAHNDPQQLSQHERTVRDFLLGIKGVENLEDSNTPIEGEIYISLPRIIANAKKYRNSLNNEFKRIIIHGLLHLVGYNDLTNSDKKQMTSLEDKYINLSKGEIISH